jgi:hypothetical protein
MHEGNVQRAVKYARRKLGISVLPHELRRDKMLAIARRTANPDQRTALKGIKGAI